MTDAASVWAGAFGAEYTDRNALEPEELDRLYVERYGVSRTDLNREFLGGLQVASALEVGCNRGMQLRHLRRDLPWTLTGIDVQEDALRLAAVAVPDARLLRARADALPFPDASFDLVFTSGVLIHIPPATLPRVLDEVHRCARRYVWGLEYWAATPTEVPYRGHAGLLWKRDFEAAYRHAHPDLRPLRSRRLPIRGTELEDRMFLLEKPPA